MHEGPGHLEAALVGERQGAGQVVAPLLETDEVRACPTPGRAACPRRDGCPACPGATGPGRHRPAAWAPTSTFSSTVMRRQICRFWNVRAMPRRLRAWAGSSSTSVPLKRTAPDVGVCTPDDHVDERRLARAVGTDEGVHGAAPHVEVESLRAATPPKRFVRARTTSSRAPTRPQPEAVTRAGPRPPGSSAGRAPARL